MNLLYDTPTRASNRLLLPTPISCLRFLAAALGVSILLFVGPFVMVWGVVASLTSVTPDAPLLIFLKVLSFIILLAAGYCLLGVYGHRVIQSLKLRVTAAMLLAFPIVFTVIRLREHHMEMPFLLAVLLLSIFLLTAFVWPVWLKLPGQPFNANIPTGDPTGNRCQLTGN